MNGGITSPLLVTTPNSMMWTGLLVFISLNMTIIRLTRDHFEVLIVELPSWTANYKACRFKISWEVNSVMFLLSSQTVSTDSSLLHSRQNPKKIKYQFEIIQNGNNLPIAPTICTFIYMCVYACIYTHIYVCMYICVCIYVCVCVCVYIYIDMYIHVCIYVYIRM